MTVRMRHTRGHTNNRRSHHKLKNPAITKDEQGNARLRHRVSMATGTYRGRKVLDLSSKLDKKTKKVTEKEAAR